MEAMMVDYHALSRKELQALCKQHKIPANKTNLFMADSLAALLGNANANEPEVVDAPISGAKEADFVGMTEPPIVLRAEESVGEAPCESPADDADNTIAVVKKASKGRAAKKTAAATPTPVGPEDVCSAVKPATKRATVRGKVSSLAKLTATEINEGSDEAAGEAEAEAEAEGKPAGRNAAANVKTAKLSNLKEDSCVTLQELGPEEMAGEFVADSEVPAAPEVVEVKKAVKGKRTGKKAQIDVIEQAVVETATMVIEEATLMEEAPVIEEANEAAPVPEALMETKKVRGKRVAKKTQVDVQVDAQVDTAELLETEAVETPPILIEAMVEEEIRVEEPLEIAAVEAKKVRGKRVGKKAQDFVETAPILTEVITAPVEAPPQVVENLAADCVEDHEAMCEEAIPLVEVKKALKGKRGGRKPKVAQKAELPELMDTEAIDEEAEQAVEEVQENKTVKAIVSQFEQLTVGVVAEEVDGTPVVETDTKMQEIVVAEQVDDIDQVDDNIAEAVPELEQSAEEVELPKAAAKKAGRGKKAAKEKAVKGKPGKPKAGAVTQASPPAIEIYCDIVVDEVQEEAANPIAEDEEPSSPVHGAAGHLSLASPVKSPSLAHHIENDSDMESGDECDEAPTPLVHNMQRGARKDQNMMMEVVDKENAMKSNIGDYPQSLRKLRKQLKEAIIKKKGSTPLASPLQDISLNVQSPRVDQSPSFSFQF